MSDNVILDKKRNLFTTSDYFFWRNGFAFMYASAHGKVTLTTKFSPYRMKRMNMYLKEQKKLFSKYSEDLGPEFNNLVDSFSESIANLLAQKTEQRSALKFGPKAPPLSCIEEILRFIHKTKGDEETRFMFFKNFKSDSLLMKYLNNIHARKSARLSWGLLLVAGQRNYSGFNKKFEMPGMNGSLPYNEAIIKYRETLERMYLRIVCRLEKTPKSYTPELKKKLELFYQKVDSEPLIYSD